MMNDRRDLGHPIERHQIRGADNGRAKKEKAVMKQNDEKQM